MGFKVQRKTFRLRFKDSEMAGLEVLAKSLTTGQFLEMEHARAARAAGDAGSEGATATMIDLLAGALVSWNAEDEAGMPIPATAEGIRSQDLDFTMQVIDAWTDAIAGVPRPLSQPSSDGLPSLEASIPMDVPSELLVS